MKGVDPLLQDEEEPSLGPLQMAGLVARRAKGKPQRGFHPDEEKQVVTRKLQVKQRPMLGYREKSGLLVKRKGIVSDCTHNWRVNKRNSTT